MTTLGVVDSFCQHWWSPRCSFICSAYQLGCYCSGSCSNWQVVQTQLTVTTRRGGGGWIHLNTSAYWKWASNNPKYRQPSNNFENTSQSRRATRSIPLIAIWEAQKETREVFSSPGCREIRVYLASYLIYQTHFVWFCARQFCCYFWTDTSKVEHSGWFLGPVCEAGTLLQYWSLLPVTVTDPEGMAGDLSGKV